MALRDEMGEDVLLPVAEEEERAAAVATLEVAEEAEEGTLMPDGPDSERDLKAAAAVSPRKKPKKGKGKKGKKARKKGATKPRGSSAGSVTSTAITGTADKESVDGVSLAERRAARRANAYREEETFDVLAQAHEYMHSMEQALVVVRQQMLERHSARVAAPDAPMFAQLRSEFAAENKHVCELDSTLSLLSDDVSRLVYKQRAENDALRCAFFIDSYS